MALELTEEQRKAGWQVLPLSQCFHIIGGGTPKTTISEYWNGNIPWLSVTDFVGDGRTVFETEKTITELGLEKSSTRLLDVGDLIVSARGTVGELAQLSRPMAFNQSCYGLRGIDGVITNEYGFYLMKTTINKLKQQSYGSVFSTITRSTFQNIEVSLPPLDEQKRIADILGSVDDKIEANSRLIDSLEELADLTFDRYLENLADELETTTYASLNFFGGGTPNTKTPEYWDGEINWVTPTDVTSLKSHVLFESSRKITEEGLSACSSKLHPAGSIMMTSRATVGRFAVNQVPAATNQGFIVVQPENETERWWIYHHMKKDVELFLQLANGATFLELSRKVFRDIPLKIYRGKTELPDIHKQIIALEAENRSLVETRDLLIRQLII